MSLSSAFSSFRPEVLPQHCAVRSRHPPVSWIGIGIGIGIVTDADVDVAVDVAVAVLLQLRPN